MKNFENSNSGDPVESTQWDSLTQTENVESSKDVERSKEEHDSEKIHQAEMAEVLRDKEHVGLNITGISLPNPAVTRSLKEVADIARLDKNFEMTEETTEDLMNAALKKAHEKINERLAKSGRSPIPDSMAASFLQGIIDGEKAKDAYLHRIISEMPQGASARIHPSGESSPYSVESFLQDGGFSEQALDIVKSLLEKTKSETEGDPDGHLTVVINNYGSNPERPGNIPTTEEGMQNYAGACLAFLDGLNLQSSEEASRLTLELGNETNTSPDMGQEFVKPTFVESPNPEDYAKMFVYVSNEVKKKFPDVKMSLAGTAFLDPDYVSRVVNEAIRIGGADAIDEISYHPYKNTESSFTSVISEGQYSSLSKIDNPAIRKLVAEGAFGKFDENGQLIEPSQYSASELELMIMREIASTLDTAKSNPEGNKTEVTVGEIGFFNWGESGVDSVNTEELPKQTQFAAKNGVRSYIWPGNDLNNGRGIPEA